MKIVSGIGDGFLIFTTPTAAVGTAQYRSLSQSLTSIDQQVTFTVIPVYAHHRLILTGNVTKEGRNAMARYVKTFHTCWYMKSKKETFSKRVGVKRKIIGR